MKKRIVILGILINTLISFLSGVFADEQKDENMNQEKNPQEVYRDLRNMALQISASQLKLNIQDPSTPYGILMETGYPEAVVTLLAFSDGAVSLYFSNGGGMIGGGEYKNVRDAGAKFIQESAKHISRMPKVADYPAPAVGQTRFYVLTGNGIYSVEQKEEILGEGKDNLSALFYAGQEVITQFRLASEKR